MRVVQATTLMLLAAALAIWFGYSLGTRALWSPDEGRYAEIPREMVASNDYVTPRLNGVKYFEKPPLLYWLTAGSVRAFGLSEWALRLWPALFAAFGCLAVYGLGARLFGPAAGLLAAGVLATSPLYDLMGRALTTDMPVAVLITVALGAYLLAVCEPPGALRRCALYAFYAAVGLAVLAKGLIGILIPALVIGAWTVLLGEWKMLREMRPAAGAAIVIGIAAPWHLLVGAANPEFAQFYFVHEHIERFLTTSHGRYQPPWFFIVVLLAGMFPWSAFLPATLTTVAKGWRERRTQRETWFLLLWALVPFTFFSASGSKLAPYILPALPPLALLLGRRLAQAWQGSARLPATAFAALLVLGLSLCIVIFAGPRIFAERESFGRAATYLGASLDWIAVALLAAGVAPFAASLATRGKGTYRVAIAVLLACAAGLSLLLQNVLPRLDGLYSVKATASALRERLRPGDEVMTYEAYYQDLPVYLERRITIVGWTGELLFGSTIENARGWMIDEAALRKRWREPRTIYLLADAARLKDLSLPQPSCLLHSTERIAVHVNRKCLS